MEGQIFMVAAVLNPKKKEIEEDGTLSKLILPPTPIVARDDKDACIKAVMDCEELKNVDRDRLEVVCHPF